MTLAVLRVRKHKRRAASTAGMLGRKETLSAFGLQQNLTSQRSTPTGPPAKVVASTRNQYGRYCGNGVGKTLNLTQQACNTQHAYGSTKQRAREWRQSDACAKAVCRKSIRRRWVQGGDIQIIASAQLQHMRSADAAKPTATGKRLRLDRNGRRRRCIGERLVCQRIRVCLQLFLWRLLLSKVQIAAQLNSVSGGEAKGICTNATGDIKNDHAHHRWLDSAAASVATIAIDSTTSRCAPRRRPRFSAPAEPCRTALGATQ